MRTIVKKTDGGDTFYHVADPDEPTRPDHITMQHWRRLASAFDAVPTARREAFLNAVAALSQTYQVAMPGED